MSATVASNTSNASINISSSSSKQTTPTDEEVDDLPRYASMEILLSCGGTKDVAIGVLAPVRCAMQLFMASLTSCAA
jgi:hypothetical protein